MLSVLFQPLPIASLSAGDRVFLRAAREWVMLACRQRDPRPAISRLLGVGPAARFGMLMDGLTAAWTEPFTTHPPCAARLTGDEATLLALLAAAAGDDRLTFDQWLRDMLGADVRQRLWDAACRVSADRATAW